MDYMNRYYEWVQADNLDPNLREELTELFGQWEKIKDRFCKDLDFGTAGMRGIMGAGTNRMNVVTVAEVTQALANVIAQSPNGKEKGVVIAYDTRDKSDQFAWVAAEVLAANNITTYVFDGPRPTPELSFAVRFLNAQAGIMITASHNPPEYNGYKVYWADGGQVLPNLANQVTQEAAKLDGLDVLGNLPKSPNKGLISVIGHEIDRSYLEAVKQCMLMPDLASDKGHILGVVYTPLHGTGANLLLRVLTEVGFSNVEPVLEQMQPDPDFNTVRVPNPEEAEAFKLGLRLAQDEQADLVLATDPDADRVGVMVRARHGQYIKLSGNQIGALLLNYILAVRIEQGALPSNAVVLKSIVSTELARAIARHYDVETMDTLTGFKYIGEKITQFEESGEKKFLFGFEESYGYLVGTHARDKDAIVASLLICEMVLYYKLQGMTLCDVLEQIYRQFGFYQEEVISLKFDTDDSHAMKHLMNAIREQLPQSLGYLKVSQVRDYLHKVNTDPSLPIADMLCFVLEDDSRIFFRPSGTEPKVKVYIHTKAETKEKAELKLEKLKQDALHLLQNAQHTSTTKRQTAATDNPTR